MVRCGGVRRRRADARRGRPAVGRRRRMAGLVRRIARCFRRDARDPRLVEHSVATLIGPAWLSASAFHRNPLPTASHGVDTDQVVGIAADRGEVGVAVGDLPDICPGVSGTKNSSPRPSFSLATFALRRASTSPRGRCGGPGGPSTLLRSWPPCAARAGRRSRDCAGAQGTIPALERGGGRANGEAGIQLRRLPPRLLECPALGTARELTRSRISRSMLPRCSRMTCPRAVCF